MRKNRTVLKKVCEAIDNKKGEDVSILDVSRISSFADFLVICQGYNAKQNQTICDEIVVKLKKEAGLTPSHIEGYTHAEWILIDYLNFIVHIFSARARDYYKLERLWSDGVEVKRKVLSA